MPLPDASRARTRCAPFLHAAMARGDGTRRDARERMQQPTTTSASELGTFGREAREVVGTAATLARDEVALAKREAAWDLTRAASAALALATALGAGFVGAELLVLAIAGASRRPARASVLGVTMLGLAGASTWFAWRALPKSPMSRTRERLAADAEAIREAATGGSR